MTGTDPDNLVTLLKAKNEFEANLVVALLEDEDIHAVAFTKVRSAIPLETRLITVPVQVRSADYDRAKAVLNERGPDTSVEVDWDSVDVGERDDRLPLRTPGRTPWAARIAMLLAWLIVLATLAGLLILFFQ